MTTLNRPRAVWFALVLGLGGCSSLVGDPAVGDLGLVQDAMRQVQNSYVVPVEPDKMVSGALKGMLSKLDHHSDYMTENEYRELMATTSGQFGGIGIEVSVEEGSAKWSRRSRTWRPRPAASPATASSRRTGRRSWDGYRRGGSPGAAHPAAGSR
jgi:hypothetical protein